MRLVRRQQQLAEGRAPQRRTTDARRLTSSVMISRNRSAPTAAAISIEWTTSANKTVTCLYSACWDSAIAEPQAGCLEMDFR
jgi:hypothetical protein